MAEIISKSANGFIKVVGIKQQFYEVKYYCRNCIYFKACGYNMRTEPCKGRKTKSELKKENKNDYNK